MFFSPTIAPPPRLRWLPYLLPWIAGPRFENKDARSLWPWSVTLSATQARPLTVSVERETRIGDPLYRDRKGGTVNDGAVRRLDAAQIRTHVFRFRPREFGHLSYVAELGRPLYYFLRCSGERDTPRPQGPGILRPMAANPEAYSREEMLRGFPCPGFDHRGGRIPIAEIVRSINRRTRSRSFPNFIFGAFLPASLSVVVAHTPRPAAVDILETWYPFATSGRAKTSTLCQ